VTPVVIISRDRVTYLRRCIGSLMRLRDVDIHIIDHGSTWPPMLDLLERSTFPIYRLGDAGPRALWWEHRFALASIVKGERYVVTDPDIVLAEHCPTDVLYRMNRVLDANPTFRKCGVSLRIDDLPDTELARGAERWERQYWQTHVTNAHAFLAPIDTTLALYRSLDEFPSFDIGPAARLWPPYTAHHLPWYEETLDEELTYYREHALEGASHWEAVRANPNV
jgi:hypothetical protein